MEQDDGELTLDDLETKFSIDDIDVNPIVNPSEVNNLSISLNSKRQIGLNLKCIGFRGRHRPYFSIAQDLRVSRLMLLDCHFRN